MTVLYCIVTRNTWALLLFREATQEPWNTGKHFRFEIGMLVFTLSLFIAGVDSFCWSRPTTVHEAWTVCSMAFAEWDFNFSRENRKLLVQSTFISVLDYGDIIYMHAGDLVLKQLDTIYHSALRFITGDKFRTHHCTLYQSVGWSSLSDRRVQHQLLYIYKAILQKLPDYLNSLLSWCTGHYQTRSQDYLLLDIPFARKEIGKKAFKHYAPRVWNTFQESTKLDTLIPLGSFKHLINSDSHHICNCFS